MASKSNASGGRGAAIGTGDNSPSDVGGYSTELFVELPLKDLICNKCEKVLRDPRQTECGHLYCAQCIAASENHSCYVSDSCSGKLSTRASSKDYQRGNQIRGFLVQCPERGCEWEGKLEHLEVHAREQCAYREVDCEYAFAGCTVRIVAKELDEHIALNTQQHLRLVAVHFHGQEVNKDGRNGGGVKELGAAHQYVQRGREWEEISGRRSPYGGTLCIIIIVALMALSTIYNLHYSVNKDELTILKTEIDALSLKLCLLEYKKGRSGPEFGDHVCALEENINHLADFEYCSSLTTKQFIERSEFDDRIQAVKENVENSSINNDFEERISAIENVLSKNSAFEDRATDDGNNSIKDFEKRISAMEEQFINHTTESHFIRAMEEKIKNISVDFEDRISAMEEQIKCHASESNVRKHTQAMEKQIKDLEASMQRRAAQVESLLTEIHSLKKEVKKVKTLTELKLKDFERDLQTPTTYRTLPLEIKVPISLGHDKEWYSSTFYSHDRGYRMQLIVNDTIPWETCTTLLFNIMNCVKAKHRQYLGVHVQILPGEFDNSLQWPTLFKLTIRLLHPKWTFQPGMSIRAELYPNHGHVGWEDYISIDDAKKYIETNSLHFKIYKLV